MARDGSGTYLLPAGNPVVASTTITSAQFNTTMTDVAAALSGSLPRDGQAAMTGPFRLADGNSTTPAFAFNAEASTGLFRPGTGILGFSVSGGERLRLFANGNLLLGATSDTGERLQITGTAKITGATALQSTLGVTGATTLSSTLGVTGATTLSTLGVTGLSTLSTVAITSASTVLNIATTNGAGDIVADASITRNGLGTDVGQGASFQLTTPGSAVSTILQQSSTASEIWSYSTGLGWGKGLSITNATLGASFAGNISAANITPTSGVASRIVQADGSGYIFNSYFNSVDNSVSSGVTGVMVKVGDNFLRTSTAAGIQSFINSPVLAGANSFTGAVNTFQCNNAAITAASQIGGLEAYGNGGGGAAGMSFHRPGNYAVNFGLDSDNSVRLGGWSDGTTSRFTSDSSGNFAARGAFFPSGGSSYLRSPTGTYGGLEVVGSTTGYGGISFATSCSGTNVMFDGSGNGGHWDSTSDWHFYYNRSHLCLAIGGSATDPSYKLNVNGAARVAGNLAATGEAYSTSGRIQSASPTLNMQDTDNVGAFFHVNSGVIYYLRADAANSLTWDSGPNGRHPMTLDLSTGNVTFSGDVTAFSDIRLKRNVETIGGALDKVSTLRGVTFDHIETGRGTGLIAQEVQAVLPEAVHTTKNGAGEEYLTLAYGNLVGLLVEAIKELRAEVAALKAT